MTMLPIAFCVLLASSALAFPSDDAARFSDEELQRYFGVDSHAEAPEYEIVYPTFMTAESKRHFGRSAIAAKYLEIDVEAFGETLSLELNHDDESVKSGLEAEYITDEGTVKMPVRTDCMYTGKVAGEANSMASVTTCMGLMAVVNHATGPTYIEPLDDIHAFKRDIGRGLPHLAYKRMPDNGAFCPVTADSVYAQYQDAEADEDEAKHVDTESTKYLELAMIGDSVLYDLRGGNTETCLKTLFLAARNVLQLSSLDGSNTLLPKLVNIKIFTSSETGIQTCPDALTSLQRTRDWANTNNPTNSYHWDNAALLTGWSMEGGSTLGIAYVGSCGSRYSVSVSTFRNLDTTNVLAHEIGHNLGISHDSDGNGCSGSGYVMAAYVNDHRADPSWSTCSKSYYNSFVGSNSCYNDGSSDNYSFP